MGLRGPLVRTRKYAISLAQLPAARYRCAFEPGCSVGVLTQMLALRCDALLACDVAEAAVRAAAGRTRELPHVRVEQRDIAGHWPSGRFDLIVFSEILYYFGDRHLEQVLKNAVAALEPEGTLLAVHWRHPVADYPRSGDDVHHVLAAQPGWPASSATPSRLPGRGVPPHRRDAGIGGPGDGSVRGGRPPRGGGCRRAGHNEETLLPACLVALRRAVNAVGIPVQVLVVADACTDQTAVTAQACGAGVISIRARNVGAARARHDRTAPSDGGP